MSKTNKYQKPEIKKNFYKKIKRILIVLSLILLLVISLNVFQKKQTASAINENNISTITTATPDQLVDALLNGKAGINVTNLTYVGNVETNEDTGATPYDQSGIFSGTDTVIGMDHGIVLTTGRAKDIVNNNGKWGPYFTAYVQANSLADQDAVNLSNSGGRSCDPNSLTIEFIPDTDTIKFDFVFASEEYPFYIGTKYNDVFGLYVNNENYALVPGTDDLITINSINDQANPEYIVKNGGLWGGVFSPPDYEFIYDGWTRVIPVVAKVNPGVKNTIKFMISDIGDRAFDSAVFISNLATVPDNGSIELTKTVTGSAPADEDYTFTLTKDSVPATGTCTIDGVLTNIPSDGQIQLTAGQTATLAALEVGDYQIVESDPGPNYSTTYNVNGVVSSGRSTTVSVTKDATTKVKCINKYSMLGKLTLTKEDSADSSKKLSGAVFEIWDTNGTASDTTDDVLVTTTTATTADGTVTIFSLPYGTYRFVETTTPTGYQTPLGGNITASELIDTSTTHGSTGGMFTVNEATETATITNEQALLSAVKSAKVLPDGDESTGTAGNPVLVDIGDEIEYTISVENNVPAARARYDIVFVLDWSSSMDNPYTGTNTTSSRLRAKDTILYMSQQIFANYPDSRVAVMGLNTADTASNLNDPTLLNLQVDTPFVGPADYATTIQNAFANEPVYSHDDNRYFLSAAIDKQLGLSTAYGSNTWRKKVIPRTDLSRTPVIVLISDFQMTSSYFSNYVKLETNRFAASFDDGILLVVRTDHKGNATNSTTTYDKIMEDNIMAPGNGRWGWVKFQGGQTQEIQNELLWQLIGAKAPAVLPQATTITDMLPEGLEYVDSSNGGVLGADNRTVTWDLADLPEGETTVTVKVRVTDPGTYVNQATVAIDGYEDPIETNETYHATRTITGDLTITKQDSVDSSKKLSGAVFEIWDTKETADTTDDVLVTTTTATTADGTVTISSLPYGTYRFVETTTPTGYQTPLGGNITASELIDTSTTHGSTGGTFTVNEATETATITNVKNGIDFTFTKIDGNVFAATKGTVIPLPGAEFAIFQCLTLGKEQTLVPIEVINGTGTSLDWRPVMVNPDGTGEVPYRVTSGADGVVTFKALENGSYVLVETKAPNVNGQQYDLPSGQWAIKVDSSKETSITKEAIADASGQSPPAFTVNNQLPNLQQNDLPMAGGMGTTVFILIGSLLLMIGILLLVIRQKRLINNRLI